MEIICVICKHTDRTEEQRERHVQTAEHIRNNEIYTMGLEHGEQHGKKQIAALQAQVKQLTEALEPFADFLDTALQGHTSGWSDRVGDDRVVFAWNEADMTLGMLKRAKELVTK